MARIYGLKCKWPDGRTHYLMRTAGVESVCVLEQGEAVLKMPEELTWASQIILNPGQLHDPAFIDKFEVNDMNGWEDVPHGLLLVFEFEDATKAETPFQTGGLQVYVMNLKSKQGEYVPVRDVRVGNVVWCASSAQYGKIIEVRCL